MQTDPSRFNPDLQRTLLDTNTQLFLSSASSWEIAIKYALGKLPLPEEPRTYVPSRMRLSGTSGLPVEHAHALHVASLPLHHRDPFDRLLVAQAQLESMPILTADPVLAMYEIAVVSP
jgi:PIN domain nuclease of toxin-antitoxin system